MGLNLNPDDAGKDFAKCPEGSLISRCFALVDLGTQHGEWQGKPKTSKKLIFGFEVLDDQAGRREDGKPFQLWREYTANLGDKANLKADLVSWGAKIESGKNIALSSFVGKYAQTTVVHEARNGKTYANIAAISGLHPSIPKPAAVLPNVIFDFDSDDYMSAFNTLPEWIQKKIQDSDEWKDEGTKAPAPKPDPSAPAESAGNFSDDIPF